MKDKTYGYEISNGKLRVQKKEAKVIRFIFEELMNEVTPTMIATILNEQKVETRKKNGKWTHARIVQIIRNKRYSGELGYPPIVSKHLQKQTIQILESSSLSKYRLDSSQRNKQSPFYKKIKCAECGYSMWLYEKGGPKFWRCTSNKFAICDVYHKWDGVLDEDIHHVTVAMINELAENIDLIQNVGTLHHNLLEIVKLENELKEKINHDPFNIKAIEELLLKKYELKYEQFVHDYISETVQLQYYLKRIGAVSKLTHEIVNKIINKIEISRDGKIIYTLNNHQKVTKSITIVREIPHG